MHLLQEFTIRNNENSDSEEEEEEMLRAEPLSSTEGQEESLTNTNSLSTVSNSTVRRPLASRVLGFHSHRNCRQVFQYSPDVCISENILESLQTQNNYFANTRNPLQVNEDIMKEIHWYKFYHGCTEIPHAKHVLERKNKDFHY